MMIATTPPARQRGSALIVALMALLVLSMLGMSASRGTVMQNAMLYNDRMHLEAFHGALIEGKMQLAHINNSATTSGNAAMDSMMAVDMVNGMATMTSTNANEHMPNDMQITVTHESDRVMGRCPDLGESVVERANDMAVQCMLVDMTIEAAMSHSSAKSEQITRYAYYMLVANQ